MSRLYTALVGVVVGSAAAFGLTKLVAATRQDALDGGSQPSLPNGEPGESEPDTATEDDSGGGDVEVPEVPTIAVELPAFVPTPEIENAVLTTLSSQAASDTSQSDLPAPLDQYRAEYGPKVVWWTDVAFHKHFEFLPWGRFDPSKESHTKWIGAYLDVLMAQAGMADATDGLKDALTSSPFYGMGANATEEQLERLDPNYEPPPEEEDEPEGEIEPDAPPPVLPVPPAPPAPKPKGPNEFAQLMSHMAKRWA
ncbi:MAG: hypothetical protein KC468_03275 [Myxococcales bacterium]|nr:hypothetical protein [Myxococcales bacterium]